MIVAKAKDLTFINESWWQIRVKWPIKYCMHIELEIIDLLQYWNILNYWHFVSFLDSKGFKICVNYEGWSYI